MKRELNPAVVAAVVIALVAIAGYFLYTRTGGSEAATPQSNPMPKEAGEQMRRMMQNVNQQRQQNQPR
jgi:cytochrome c-type biogenesis protein CcmH/NrfG